MRHYSTFLNRNQPKNDKKGCCSKMSCAFIIRFAIRSIIPIGLGIGLGALAEWGERKLGMHNDNALAEISDCVGCAVTLIATYTINALLNCCWPANPYQQTLFFQSSEQDIENNNSVNTTGLGI